jgi:hypothetical protein
MTSSLQRHSKETKALACHESSRRSQGVSVPVPDRAVGEEKRRKRTGVALAA